MWGGSESFGGAEGGDLAHLMPAKANGDLWEAGTGEAGGAWGCCFGKFTPCVVLCVHRGAFLGLPVGFPGTGVLG